MGIPAFHELMLPLLKLFSDQKERSNRELNDFQYQLDLSEEERNEKLSNGGFRILDRIHWARTYLKQAGLLYYPNRGITKITDLGIEVLSRKPQTIDVDYLQQFEGFQDFQRRKRGDKDLLEFSLEKQISILETKSTPEETFNSSYKEINSVLQSNLLDKVKSCSPRFFEKLVLDLLLSMGYGNSNLDSAELTAYTNDKGIDGIVKEDTLGLDKIYLQAKRWESSIGRKELQEFVGALAGKRAKKGVFITTSKFNDNAIQYIESELGTDTKVVLIDGEKLSELMIKFNVGVSIKQTYQLKRIDTDYFEDEIL